MRTFNERFSRLTAAILLAVILVLQLASCSFGSGTGDGFGNPDAPLISLDSIPEYSGKAYVAINGNVPFFEEDELTTVAYESYSELDGLGRCGVAVACVGKELMPTEDRESISSVFPSGWKHKGKSNNNQYDFVDGEYIYNRCHLIGFQLTGENANEKNLITGTRYLNIDGMLLFENMVAAYVKDTGYHVMLRVTPIFNELDLVCRGVLMEGYSVEDEGEGICFCIYAYNVQPNVYINYYTGENKLSADAKDEEEDVFESSVTYVLNINTKKYHLPECSSATEMLDKNREDYTGTVEDFATRYPGYSPCGSCKPHESR